MLQLVSVKKEVDRESTEHAIEDTGQNRVPVKLRVLYVEWTQRNIADAHCHRYHDEEGVTEA